MLRTHEPADSASMDVRVTLNAPPVLVVLFEPSAYFLSDDTPCVEGSDYLLSKPNLGLQAHRFIVSVYRHSNLSFSELSVWPGLWVNI